MKVADQSKKEEEDAFCVWGYDPFKQEAAEEDEKKYQEIEFNICDDENEDYFEEDVETNQIWKILDLLVKNATFPADVGMI